MPLRFDELVQGRDGVSVSDIHLRVVTGAFGDDDLRAAGFAELIEERGIIAAVPEHPAPRVEFCTLQLLRRVEEDIDEWRLYWRRFPDPLPEGVGQHGEPRIEALEDALARVWAGEGQEDTEAILYLHQTRPIRPPCASN